MPYVFKSKVAKTGKLHRNWRFQFTDYQGVRRTGTGTPSKTETKKIAFDKQAEHDAIRRGLKPIPHESKKYEKIGFDEVIASYLSWGELQGGRGGRPWGKGHARMKRSHLQWWNDTLDCEVLGDLLYCKSTVEISLRTLLKKGKSGKTYNNYLEALQSLVTWCLKKKYLKINPFEDIAYIDATPCNALCIMDSQSEQLCC